MVARISTPSAIKKALNYNEQKLQNGQAILLYAEGFLKDAEQLNFYEKLDRFEQLIRLNTRAKTNSLHISLNFDTTDKTDRGKLVTIAASYMSKIGFGEQPYLVYQHLDAGHPHIHIVTTSIKPDGSRIDTFNIGKNQSEKARKEIEESFGLVPAERHKRKQDFELSPVNACRVQYGRNETKRAISNVLNVVVKEYKYTSLQELNAILKQFNIIADQCSENSRIYRNNGLVYQVLDAQGNKVGVPIKASSFYSKPTLAFLKEKFAINGAARQPYKARIKNAIDLAILKQKNITLQGLITGLGKEGIHTVLRQNESGFVYGITYVDHQTKSVFNGSALGKQYSAKGILERCCNEGKETSLQTQQVVKQPVFKIAFAEERISASAAGEEKQSIALLERLINPESATVYAPNQLIKKNRKKKKKLLQNR